MTFVRVVFWNWNLCIQIGQVATQLFIFAVQNNYKISCKIAFPRWA